MLVATAVVPVGVARAVLGLLMSQLTRLRATTPPGKTAQPVAEPVATTAPVVS
jgi:hypothetical protein